MDISQGTKEEELKKERENWIKSFMRKNTIQGKDTDSFIALTKLFYLSITHHVHSVLCKRTFLSIQTIV